MVTTILILLFIIPVLLIFHSYVIYPFTLLVTERKSRPAMRVEKKALPKVSVLVSAYNEESNIKAKIQNLLQLEFPQDRLEIVIGVDGATDKTYEVASAFSGRNLIVINFPVRRGKIAVLNDLVAKSNGEILIFTDADVELDKLSVMNLITHFDNERIGGACGRYVLRPKEMANGPDVELTYWIMENWIKKLEGGRGVVLGANGGVYSIRKNHFIPFEPQVPIADDFILPLKIIEAGYDFVYEPKALAYGKSASFPDEFKRKIRIGAQDFNGLRIVRPLLNPSRGFVSYALWSHKVLRWFVPHLLLLAFASNALLASHFRFFYFTMQMQVLFYVAAIIGSVSLLLKLDIPILSQIGYFVSANAALFVGFIKSIFKGQGTKWEVSRS